MALSCVVTTVRGVALMAILLIGVDPWLWYREENPGDDIIVAHGTRGSWNIDF